MKRLVLITLTATLFAAFHQALSVKALQAQGAVPADVQKAIQRLKSPLAVERVGACIELGEIGSRAAAAVPFLIELFGDLEDVTMKVSFGESPSVVLESMTYPREQALLALIKIGEPAVGPLVAAISTARTGRATRGAVRSAIIRALGQIGEPAVGELLRLLGTVPRERREDVINALGETRDARAVEPLIEPLLNDSERKLLFFRVHANALRLITGQEFSSTADWVKWWELNKTRFRRP